jgi:hypothetical protein
MSRSHLIAALMSVIAVAAMVITGIGAATRSRAPAPGPLAPGLAALTGQQLADMLPRESDFPAGWTRVDTYGSRADGFGYSRYHSIGASFSHQPAECFDVVYGGATGSFPAAEIGEHDPTDPPYEYPRHEDMSVKIGREFNPAVFDEMTKRVSRCLHSVARSPATLYTVRILEDSRPAGGPQRFRYSVTTAYGEEPSHVMSVGYYSYARLSGLILTASSDDGRQDLLDPLFENTIGRIRAAA